MRRAAAPKKQTLPPGAFVKLPSALRQQSVMRRPAAPKRGEAVWVLPDIDRDREILV